MEGSVEFGAGAMERGTGALAGKYETFAFSTTDRWTATPSSLSVTVVSIRSDDLTDKIIESVLHRWPANSASPQIQ